MTEPLSRRLFLQGSAAAGLGYFFTAPAYSARRAADGPNGKIRFAGIGVGGKGDGDISQAGSLGEVVAICDIDENTLDRKAKQFPQAKKFFDFRKLLDTMEKEIDAITVSTPDHTHTLPSVLAMRMKKHVYCQKPLTHSVFEAHSHARNSQEIWRMHPNGQSGHRSGRPPSRRRVHSGRWTREGEGSSCMDQSADLAASTGRDQTAR